MSKINLLFKNLFFKFYYFSESDSSIIFFFRRLVLRTFDRAWNNIFVFFRAMYDPWLPLVAQISDLERLLSYTFLFVSLKSSKWALNT